MLFPVRTRRILPATFILLFSLGLGAAAQTPPSQAPLVQANRILPQPDLARTTRLSGHLPAWVDPSTDAGAVPDSTPVRLTLVLSRSPALQVAFEQLLTDQQNPSSPRYHHWLTPTQIGEQFGPTLDDVGAITTWLTASGLHLAELSPARTFLTVTGTAGVAASTFATTFHQFTYDGQPHLSATTEPAIPTAFATVINSIQGLTDIPVHPMVHVRPAQPRAAPDSLEPLYSSSNGLVHYVFPGDFATIYNITPTTRAGYTGSGVRVAVIGRSQIANSDITELENLAHLPQRTPTVVLVPGSADPGVVSSETDESTLDVGRVITTATGAPVDLVIAASAAGGIAAAIQYNINTLQDPVMTISYGACESAAGATGVNFYNTLFAQAAAQGMSIFASSGDAAAAGCSPNFSTPNGMETLGMGNYICANAYVTCVGGTQFNDANPASFWAPGQTTAPYASALGYIPEGAWNEPTTTNSNGATVFQIAGSGSGPSAFIPKPSWQTGTGVPADGARDIPDVSFTSSSHDGIFGCLAYLGAAADCSLGHGIIFYGTSAAAPSMAAIAAILDQRLGSAQGNLNPLLYRLAASAPAAFHDATPASSGVSGCTTVTATLCNNSVASPTSISGGLAGYPLQVGYDLVTGLGSLDVTKFVNAAVTAALNVTTTTVSAAPTTISTTQTVVFSATVTSAGSARPTGTVQFASNGTNIGQPATLGNGTASSTALSFPTAGTYAITAIYSGDSASAASTSAPVSLVVIAGTAATSLTVTASPSALTLSSAAANTATSTLTVATPNSFSGTVTLGCAVAPTTGVPPTCSLSATTLTFTSAQSATSTLTLATITPHDRPAPGTQARRDPPLSHSLKGLSLAALLLALMPASRRRSPPRLVAMLPLTLLLGATLLTLSGCGSSTTPVSPPPPPALRGTTAGSYTVTVTATSGTTAATGTVNLAVH